MGFIMLEVYAVKQDERVVSLKYERMLSYVSVEKRDRVKRFFRREDAERALIADVLIRSIICHKTNLNNSELRFEKDKYGKPFLKYLPNFHFNLSHSGEWIACAISDYAVGVDIEKVKPIDFGIAERFFSNEEYDELMSKRDEEQLSFFYDLWTLKESYIKAVGRGLHLPLDEFALIFKNGSVFLKSEIETSPYCFRQYNIDEQYKLSVCTLGDVKEDILIIQSLDDILDKLLQ